MCEPLKDRRKMAGIDLLGLSCVAGQSQHRARDLVLAIRRKLPHGLEGFL